MALKIPNFFICAALLTIAAATSTRQQPHIIVIVADDLGWNDVGFHGSQQIPTPNIDALAYAGVILNNYYVQPICTPSRGALLSGMHPIHTGLQHSIIGGPQPYSLPQNFYLLPQYLRSLGYISRHVGKWHLGFFKKIYTPTYRGFESHYGYWSGRIDYYDHTAYEQPGYWGYDFRRDMQVDRSAYGKYTTDLFTAESVRIISNHNASQPLFLYLAHLAVHSGNPYDPLQAPADLVNKFSYIKDEKRRKFAAMLWKLDQSIGEVVTALKVNEMLENSIIVFTTDNGGPAAGFNENAASNWPLRGVKAGMWEGGVRGASFVWSPLIKNPGRVSTDMIQIIDWLPTLYSAAGGDVRTLPKMDGMNVWPTIAKQELSPRIQMLHNIDPTFNGASVRVGDWKLIFNPSGYGPQWDGWFGPSGRHEEENYEYAADLQRAEINIKTCPVGRAVRQLMPKAYRNIFTIKKSAEVLCGPVPRNATKECNNPEAPCLFNIASDPCEYHDVSSEHPTRVKYLQEILLAYNSTAVPPGNKKFDPKANPVFWDYTWTNWKDYESSLPVSYTQAHIPDPEENDLGHIWL